MDADGLSYHLGHIGIIPEIYGHDSSEEKLYAKYCDLLIYFFFKLYGMETELVTERSNAPDVIGKLGTDYKIVADAKAFRLSRTALNPKDYKIEAVGAWRTNAKANYACIVGSFFPKGRSRLFEEAGKFSVTALTYAQLRFIISDPKWTSVDLKPLWELPKSLYDTHGRKLNLTLYKGAIDDWLCSHIRSRVSLEQIRESYAKNIVEQGKLQAECLEAQKAELNSLSKEKLVKKLQEPIDNKIYQMNVRVEELSKRENMSLYF